MDIRLEPFRETQIDTVYALQRAAYRPLYEKYRDEELSPYLESRETVLRKYTREGTDGYLFWLADTAAGAVRVNVRPGEARISALCVLPELQGRGIAQSALTAIEALYPDVTLWTLDTILEEKGNCHLYEKLGYKRVGDPQPINDRMTLVYYEKRIGQAL